MGNPWDLFLNFFFASKIQTNPSSDEMRCAILAATLASVFLCATCTSTTASAPSTAKMWQELSEYCSKGLCKLSKG